MSETLKRIEAMFAQGQAREALELLREHLLEEPDDVRGLNDLGAILQSLDDSPGAEEAFRRALALSPDSYSTRTNLALILAVREKWDEARAELKSLLAVNQNDAKLWTWLAKVERTQGNLKAAVEYLDRALLNEPNQPELQKVRDRLFAEAEGGGGKPGPAAGPPSVLMCCKTSLERFANDLCEALEKRKVIVKKAVADNLGPMVWPIMSASAIWMEWGTQMAAEITRDPKLVHGKKVLLRLHSFEILSREAAAINYNLVTDVIFVSHYMRDLFNRLMPDRLQHPRVHVIHNGIDLSRFPFSPGRGRKKIAFVAKLDAKKDPMVMLQAFTFLLRRHPELELHVAGAPDSNRYYLAMPDFLTKNGLEQSTHFYGEVRDMPRWLADKDFIVSTSPIEAQGVGLLEALHRGLRPLIYSFPGAERLYPEGWLWRNFDELEELLLGGPEPEECRDFVAAKYSMDRQADNFIKVLTGEEPVVEDPPVAG